MNFIFVPLITTAIIYFIQIYICERYLLTQFITYSPQYWTFIIPIIYLILAIKKKHKIGIIVNGCLILYCCSAFLCYNSSFFEEKIKNVSYNKQNQTISINNEEYKPIKVKNLDIDPRINCQYIKTKNFDLYYIKSTVPYYSDKYQLSDNIYNKIKNNKNIVIYGDLGFPSRGLNYQLMNFRYREHKLYKYFKLNDTNHLFTSKDLEL